MNEIEIINHETVTELDVDDFEYQQPLELVIEKNDFSEICINYNVIVENCPNEDISDQVFSIKIKNTQVLSNEENNYCIDENSSYDSDYTYTYEEVTDSEFEYE